MSKVVIKKAEFYITNVCNSTCQNCNRFNDYKFSGWQRWADYAEDYQRWSEYVNFEQIVLLGGEPLLNPTILEWIAGVNKLWPKTSLQVLTNAIRLNQVPGLYDQIKTKHLNWVGVSLHNENDHAMIFEEIDKFLTKPIETLHGRENNPLGADYFFSDGNNVRVGVWNQDEFAASAVIRNKENQLTLHNSDPLVAHENCGFAQWKNYHFIRGQLYKCGPVALLPEFDEQHPLSISAEDRALLGTYRPLKSTELADRLEEFIAHIDDPLAQCKFCPEKYEPKKIFAIRKGLTQQ